MKVKSLAIVAMVVALSACSGMKAVKTETSDAKQVPSWYLDHDDYGTQAKSFWKPWDREGMYYAVAQYVSTDQEMAVNAATMRAKRKIADRVNGEMNSRTTIRFDETGSAERPNGTTTHQDVIVNQIAETVLRTYGVEKKEVLYNTDTGKWRAFVMLKISQQDVQNLAARYDANKQAKIEKRVAGKTIDETAREVLSQSRQ